MSSRDNELRSFGQRDMNILPKSAEVQPPSLKDQDRYELARTGKNQVLKRNFGLMSMLGFSCTLLATWEGQLISFFLGFTNGGPAGLVYGYVIVWIGTTSIFVVLSELASMAPTAGGQYHWCFILAPRSYQSLLSYITGWLTVAGWQAALVSGAYLTGTVIQGLIILNHTDYTPKAWHGTFLLWGVLLVSVFVNTVVSRYLPKIEGVILILHVLGFFAILVPMVALAPQTSASDVFTVFLNEGGWSSQGLSFFVGLTGTVFSFLGADGVIHMSEEVQNASVNVPRAIMAGVFINGSLGLGMLLTVLFCLGDIETVLSAPYIYPFIDIFLQGTNSIGGTTVMSSLVVLLAFCTTIGVLASSARMTWSFSRDRGLPGWRHLSKVDTKTSNPLMAILTTTMISVVLGLINIGSTTVLNDLLSLSITSWYGSYLVPSMLLLYHRLKGTIQPHFEGAIATEDTGALSWGPWNIPGTLGVINNIVACLFMTIVLFFSFWPVGTHVTAMSMNYSSVVTSGVISFSMVYYFVWGKKSYKGPIIEIRSPRLGNDNTRSWN